MVRTRRVNAKKARDDSGAGNSEDGSSSCSSPAMSDHHWEVWLMDFKKQLDQRMSRLDYKVQQEIQSLQRAFQVILFSVPAEEAAQPPSNQSQDSMIEFFAASVTTTKKSKRMITSTALKPAPSSPPKTVVRQSRARTRRTRTSSLSDADFALDMPASTRRMTRSSSQNRDICLLGTLTKYQTPSNNRPAPKFVTPKVDPDLPMPLKRYARQGEVALSLTGSPLMMTNNITEPNINLPLNNGQEVYSIMPTRGQCPSLPSLDNDTREKLIILRQNLNQILGSDV